MPHISFKIKAESISTFGTNGLITRRARSSLAKSVMLKLTDITEEKGYNIT